MDFRYSEEQTLIADSLRKLLETACTPDTRKSLLDDDKDHNPRLWQDLSDMGLSGLLVPEDHGGVGGSGIDAMIAATEFGRHLALEPFTASIVAGSAALGIAGSNEQKQQFFSGIADGSLKLAAAFLEPGRRFDLSSTATHAERTGGEYHLTGKKSAVLAAPMADMLLVSARTLAKGDADPDGISLFLVPTETAGITLRRYRLLDGKAAAEIDFDKVIVPAEAMLAPPGTAAPKIEQIADQITAAMCAEALGALERVVALTTEYLQVRKQFGQPIGRFQVLRHHLADMVIDLEHYRSLVMEAAVAADGTDAVKRKKAVSAAKVYLSEKGRPICQKAIQLHGGIGVTDEYDLGHFVKRAMVAELVFGDGDHHLERCASLLG